MNNALSVVMATYNEKRDFLQNCIQSILSQTYRDFEFLIVIEPGELNRDYLNHVAASDSRVRIIENDTRMGVAASRNRAITESRGEFVALMDGDDYCEVTRFEKQVSFLEKNPDVSVIGANMYLIDEKDRIIGERRYPQFHEDIKRSFLLVMAVANPAVMTRLADLKDVGLFDNRFSKAEDVELWLRFLARKKKMYNLPEYLVYYRVMSNSNEKRGRTHYQNFYLARKRYNKLIWPVYLSSLSLSFFFLLSHIPNGFLDILLNLGITEKLKSIKRGHALQ
ncbi:TPA: glycosyltransferase [Candidatus Woesearchaeota archaeon]|nr:glycosyltransferase [Candidatus Woesearchaeota archaeon]